MQKLKIIIGIMLIIIVSIISYFFSNPYPCSETCIGCRNIVEYFLDTWTSYVFLIGFLYGCYLIINGVFIED